MTTKHCGDYSSAGQGDIVPQTLSQPPRYFLGSHCLPPPPPFLLQNKRFLGHPFT